MKNKLSDILLGNASIKDILPGVLLAAVIAATSAGIYQGVGILFKQAGWEKNPLSIILIAMVLGLILSNVLKLPASLKPGIQFAIKKLLRLGIILMGIRLSIFAVLKIGVFALGLVAVCIASALIITIFLARMLGISQRLGTLIAAGTSICGVSAIAAVSPVIEAEEEETSYAIATITIFGLAATIFYPYLVELLLQLTSVQAGFFLGTSVHDTSQVAATALIYNQITRISDASGITGADIAITTKLVRNTFLVLVIPLLGILFNRSRTDKEKSESSGFSIRSFIPLFVIGYLIVAVIRTAGDSVFGETNAEWIASWKWVKTAAKYVIAAAIAGVGLNTNLKNLTRLGYRPFVCGLCAAVAVGGVSYTLLQLFSRYIHISGN